MGRNDIRDIISRVVGIAAVHEAKPSAISPLYRKRVEYIPEFHDCPYYNIMSVGDISCRQANRGIPVKYPIFISFCRYTFSAGMTFSHGMKIQWSIKMF